MFDKEVFNRQRDEARLFERAVARYYNIRGYRAELNPAPESDYFGRAAHDLTVIGTKQYVGECKMDYSSLWSNNACLEIEALGHSKSDFVVYGFPRAYSIPRSVALDLALNAPNKKRVGDWNLEVGLIPLKEFLFNPYMQALN